MVNIISKYFFDVNKLKEIGNNGFKMVLEKYSQELHYQNILDIYKRVL